MLTEHNRAFKEWAVVCNAMKTGRQILLIRKGGIREEDGIFRVEDPEFFLMPTYEHQNADLLQLAFVDELAKVQAAGYDPRTVKMDACAVADTVLTCEDEERLNRLAPHHVWNERYVRQRQDFNPYDPLYVILPRVYRLPQAHTVPMRPDYVGCKSWVTLERRLSTRGSLAALGDAEFARRKAEVLELLSP